MEGIESINQDVQAGLANIYKKLIAQVDRSDPSQIERILTENEIAEVIYLRDSLIQKIRSQAAMHFKEKLGSAAKAKMLSDRLDNDFPRPEIPAINVSEMMRRILAGIPRPVESPAEAQSIPTTKQASPQPNCSEEIESQKQLYKMLAITGGVVTLFSIIKLWWLLATGAAVMTAIGIIYYVDAVSKQNDTGKATQSEPITTEQTMKKPSVSPPSPAEIQQSVRVLLTRRQHEVTVLLTQMVVDQFAMVDRMTNEEVANA